MSGEVEMMSTMGDKQWSRPPISMDFQVLMPLKRKGREEGRAGREEDEGRIEARRGECGERMRSARLESWAEDGVEKGKS